RSLFVFLSTMMIIYYYRQHCLIETPKSWFDAQSYCRERGHDLATIDDMGAMKSLLALNADRADELWIGLHYGGPEEWHWSHWDQDSFVGLFPQSCAVMTGKGPGRWSQRSCDELHPFLCTCKFLKEKLGNL
uniref:C-type lectin domain-containing protein n=1 Tax=Gadus morhua TaxID=8049 RepID=A0A8C5BHA3_GADMO